MYQIMINSHEKFQVSASCIEASVIFQRNGQRRRI